MAYPEVGRTRVRELAAKYGVVHGAITSWKNQFRCMQDGKLVSHNNNSNLLCRRGDCSGELDDEDNLWIHQGYSRLIHGPNKKTLHGGSHGKVPAWAQVHLSRWFDDLHDRQVKITLTDMALDYMTVAPDECVNTTMHSLRQRMYRFARRIGIANRAITHVAQNTTHTFITQLDFVNYIKQIVVRYGIPWQNVVNGDETNCDWAISPSRMLNQHGDRTVSAQSPSSSNRCTVFLCVTATGVKLDSFVIFCGSKTGVIKKELQSLENYTTTGINYTVQKSGWIDEETMLEWVELVRKPFVESKVGLCLLILDEARTHMMAKVVCRFGDLHTLLQIIPGGYSSKIQVLDVGINHPFKTNYEDASQGFIHGWVTINPPGVKPKPICQEVSRWIYHSWEMIERKCIVNTWRHILYYDEGTAESFLSDCNEESENVFKNYEVANEETETVDTTDGSTMLS